MCFCYFALPSGAANIISILELSLCSKVWRTWCQFPALESCCPCISKMYNNLQLNVHKDTAVPKCAEKLLTDGEVVVVSSVHFRWKHCAAMKVTLWINPRFMNGCECYALIALSIYMKMLKLVRNNIKTITENNCCSNVRNLKPLINKLQWSIK